MGVLLYKLMAAQQKGGQRPKYGGQKSELSLVYPLAFKARHGR